MQDLHVVRALTASWDGESLAAVRPPVTFGFGSVPPRPRLARVTTTVGLS